MSLHLVWYNIFALWSLGCSNLIYLMRNGGCTKQALSNSGSVKTYSHGVFFIYLFNLWQEHMIDDIFLNMLKATQLLENHSYKCVSCYYLSLEQRIKDNIKITGFIVCVTRIHRREQYLISFTPALHFASILLCLSNYSEHCFFRLTLQKESKIN